MDPSRSFSLHGSPEKEHEDLTKIHLLSVRENSYSNYHSGRTYYGPGTILDALHILTHLIIMYAYLPITQVRKADKIDSSRLTLPLSSF